LHSYRSAPASAAAPIIFSTTSVPATPRRPVVWVECSTATSSLTSTVAHSHLEHVARDLEAAHVAGVVLHDHQHALAGVDPLGGGDDLVGRGAR
jgi:hypothetical protein